MLGTDDPGELARAPLAKRRLAAFAFFCELDARYEKEFPEVSKNNYCRHHMLGEPRRS